MIWWFFITPIGLILVIVRLMWGHARRQYRPRHKLGVGVDIFKPGELWRHPDLHNDVVLEPYASGLSVGAFSAGYDLSRPLLIADQYEREFVPIHTPARPWSDPESDPMGDLARWASLRPTESTKLPDWIPERAYVSKVFLAEHRVPDGMVIEGITISPRVLAEEGWDIQTDGDILRATSPTRFCEAVLLPLHTP